MAALPAIPEQDIPNTEANTGGGTQIEPAAEERDYAEPMETCAAADKEVGEGEGEAADRGGDDGDHAEPMETEEAPDNGGDDGEGAEPTESDEAADNGGDDGENAEPKDAEEAADNGGDDGEDAEPKDVEEAADNGGDDGEDDNPNESEDAADDGSDDGEDDNPNESEDAADDGGDGGEESDGKEEEQEQEEPRRPPAPRRGPKTITPGLEKIFPFCKVRLELKKDEYSDGIYNVDDPWTIWVEPYSSGRNRVWIRVWRGGNWVLLGSVVGVVDYTESRHYADSQAGFLDESEVRTPRIQVKLAAPFPHQLDAVLNMRHLVRDLCFPTYECFVWERLPYWLFCPTLAADGINEIINTPWYTLKKHSGEEQKTVSEVLPCNNVLRHPELAFKPSSHERDTTLMRFASLSPEPPYYTMWKLKSRGELELRVVDSLLRSVWQMDITSEIWNTHYVSTL